MPIRRKSTKRRSTRRKPTGRNVRRRNISFIRPKYISGPPQQQMVKFVYNTEQLIFVPNLSSTNWHTHFFRANSLFDPDVTLTGHQPRFFDQYATLYDKYRVLGCKIEFEGIVETAGAAAKIFLCPLHHIGASYTSWEGAQERKSNVSILATNQKRFKISRYMSIHAMNQVRASVVHNEDEYAARMAFNPVIVPQWQLGVAGLDATLGTVQVVGRVTLTYFTKIYQVKPVTAS